MAAMTTHRLARFSALVVALSLGAVACSSLQPTRTPSPTVAPNMTIGPSVQSTTSARPSSSREPWRVDVVNGPRRVIVSVSPGGLYFVEPNAAVTLFEMPQVQAGGIEVMEVTDSGCVLLDKTTFSAESFTIRLSGGSNGPYTLSLESGASLIGPPTAERTTDCMG